MRRDETEKEKKTERRGEEVKKKTDRKLGSLRSAWITA